MQVKIVLKLYPLKLKFYFSGLNKWENFFLLNFRLNRMSWKESTCSYSHVFYVTYFSNHYVSIFHPRTGITCMVKYLIVHIFVNISQTNNKTILVNECVVYDSRVVYGSYGSSVGHTKDRCTSYLRMSPLSTVHLWSY